VIYDNTIKQK